MLNDEDHTAWIAGAEFKEPTEIQNTLEENNNVKENSIEDNNEEITKAAVNNILESDHLKSNLTSIN